MSAYNKLTPELAQRLETVVGPGRFQYGERVKEEYSHDEMPIYGRYLPEAVVLAETTEEVSEVMRLCWENIWTLLLWLSVIIPPRRNMLSKQRRIWRTQE